MLILCYILMTSSMVISTLNNIHTRKSYPSYNFTAGLLVTIISLMASIEVTRSDQHVAYKVFMVIALAFLDMSLSGFANKAFGDVYNDYRRCPKMANMEMKEQKITCFGLNAVGTFMPWTCVAIVAYFQLNVLFVVLAAFATFKAAKSPVVERALGILTLNLFGSNDYANNTKCR